MRCYANNNLIENGNKKIIFTYILKMLQKSALLLAILIFILTLVIGYISLKLFKSPSEHYCCGCYETSGKMPSIDLNKIGILDSQCCGFLD